MRSISNPRTEVSILRSISVAIWASVLPAVFPHIEQSRSVDRRYAGQCTLREVSRARLIVEGGRELYVEPVVVEVAGEHVLVAGRPSYLFRPRQRGAMAELESTDIVFGAVITRDGTARTVAAPSVNDGKVAAVAATALGSGRWRVILAESDSVAADASDVVPSYWHGVYDGAHWSDIERLPHSPAVSLQYFNSSRLIQKGDTLVWAAVAQTGPASHGVVVFERIRGTWSQFMPSTALASGVELIHTPQHGFVLGVFRHRLGGALLRNAVENTEPAHALYLYSRQAGWKLQRLIELPVNPAIVRTRLDTSGEMLTVTSVTAGQSATPRSLQLHTVVSPGLTGDELRLIANSNATPNFATVVTEPGGVMWLSQYVIPAADTADRGELQLLRRSGHAAKVVWRTPNPYLGPFAATAYSASDLLIVGPELDQEHELLVSLIIRLRAQCVPATTRAQGGENRSPPD